MPAKDLMDRAMDKFRRQAEEVRSMQPIDAWPAEERTEEKRADRVARSMRDFWFFKRTYFTPEMYRGGYADSAPFHREIIKHGMRPGVQIVAGPRDHAKTVHGKQLAAWLLLTARREIIGTLSQTLTTASNMLVDIASIIGDNARIVEDFGVEFGEQNSEQFKLRTRDHPGWRYAAIFSEGRSVRGHSRMFGRPNWLLADDIETLTSSMEEKQVLARIAFINECYHSLDRDGTILWMCNNFDERCAVNRLLREQDKGILSDRWHVYLYPAWGTNGPLWKKRFPARTEQELRAMLHPSDEADWQGNFQQRPIKAQGIIFTRAHYREWVRLEEDLRGGMFCDPNCSLKGLGDTTAIVPGGYSPSCDKYQIVAPRCRSYDNPNDLLDDVLSARFEWVYIIGFDGNVTQESTWTNHVRNWCTINRRPFPQIEYKRYNVNRLAKNAQALWEANKIEFPPGWAETKEGERALNQIFAFTGKEAGNLDDFPDGLISLIELLNDAEMVTPSAPESETGRMDNWTTSITDYYTF
ncbi:MAG: hypothetical protein ABI876_03480 [Bacteroidota bacterium]